MNRGVLETSPAVQQLMTTGNPNWWSMNGGGGGGGNMMRPPVHPPATAPQNISSLFQPPQLLPSFLPQFLPSPTSSSSSSSPSLLKPNHNNNIPSWLDSHELPPESWSLSQLLLGGLMVGDEERMGLTHENIQGKKLENWEEQVLLSRHRGNQTSSVVDVKQENCGYNLYGYHNHQIMPNSPPNKSCVTTISTISSSTNSMLDFSSSLSNGNNNNTNNCNKGDGRHPPPDRSSECNSSETGGSVKKPKLQPPPSSQSTLKVRKEKLGGRIAALHQLVSPFGKTDTASVLSEAIGYIRFLQSQIEALSLPYFGAPSGNMRQQHNVQGGRNCVFTEDNDQFGSESIQNPNYEGPMKDLRSRGLCLVPISCTLQVGSDNGADYWAPALGPTGFP